MDVRKEPRPPLDFEIWYYNINILVEKRFFISFEVDKMEFHHC